MGIVILDGADNWPITPDLYTKWNGFDRATAARKHLIDELKA